VVVGRAVVAEEARRQTDLEALFEVPNHGNRWLIPALDVTRHCGFTVRNGVRLLEKL